MPEKLTPRLIALRVFDAGDELGEGVGVGTGVGVGVGEGLGLGLGFGLPGAMGMPPDGLSEPLADPPQPVRRVADPTASQRKRARRPSKASPTS